MNHQTILKNIEHDNNFLGYVYVIYNEIYPNDIYKIGMTSNITQRLSQYITYYIEEPEIVYHTPQIYYCNIVEKIIHEKLKKYRIKKNREYFKCPIDTIISVIDDVTNDFLTQEDAEDILINKYCKIVYPPKPKKIYQTYSRKELENKFEDFLNCENITEEEYKKLKNKNNLKEEQIKMYKYNFMDTWMIAQNECTSEFIKSKYTLTPALVNLREYINFLTLQENESIDNLKNNMSINQQKLKQFIIIYNTLNMFSEYVNTEDINQLLLTNNADLLIQFKKNKLLNFMNEINVYFRKLEINKEIIKGIKNKKLKPLFNIKNSANYLLTDGKIKNKNLNSKIVQLSEEENEQRLGLRYAIEEDIRPFLGFINNILKYIGLEIKNIISQSRNKKRIFYNLQFINNINSYI